MKLHGLVKVKTNSGATGHAITTPSVKPFEEIRAEANVSWISEVQGGSCVTEHLAHCSRKCYAVKAHNAAADGNQALPEMWA